MRSDMILGSVPRDVACAAALGVVELPQLGINLNTITLNDAQMRPKDTLSNWLDGDDPLDVATRDYLKARQEANQSKRSGYGQSGYGSSGWAAAGSTKAREEAVKRSLEARKIGYQLLVERGVLEHARAKGMRVISLS
jgi:hypothetical protein